MSTLAFTALIIGVVAACYVCGYAHGKTDGIEKGRLDEEKWWLEAGKEVEQARTEIWRTER